MQIGNKFRCYPTPVQAQTLLQWIGCQLASVLDLRNPRYNTYTWCLAVG